MFRFHLPRWRAPRPPPLAPGPKARVPMDLAHLIARAVPGAPCGWVFFDGSETRVDTDDGEGIIIPGGAFFPREARCYASESDAQEQASRLNDTSLCLDRPWCARPAAVFLARRLRMVDMVHAPF